MKQLNACGKFFAGYGMLIAYVVIMAFLSSCQYGQTVMISKGEAGGVVEMWGGQAEYCKITATPDVALTEAERLEFAKFCLEAAQ